MVENRGEDGLRMVENGRHMLHTCATQMAHTSLRFISAQKPMSRPSAPRVEGVAVADGPLGTIGATSGTTSSGVGTPAEDCLPDALRVPSNERRSSIEVLGTWAREGRQQEDQQGGRHPYDKAHGDKACS